MSTKNTDRKAKQEDEPAYRNEASNLREACGRDAVQSSDVDEYEYSDPFPKDAFTATTKSKNLRGACSFLKIGTITDEENLGKAIVDSHKMQIQLCKFNEVFNTFQNTIEEFRKIDIKFLYFGGVQPRVFVSLSSVMQILGIEYPDAIDDDDVEKEFYTFRNSYEIGIYDIMFLRPENEWTVSEEAIISIIKKVELSPEITEMFTNWLVAFFAERKAAKWMNFPVVV